MDAWRSNGRSTYHNISSLTLYEFKNSKILGLILCIQSRFVTLLLLGKKYDDMYERVGSIGLHLNYVGNNKYEAVYLKLIEVEGANYREQYIRIE
jgi:hypothetical protein